MAGQACSKQVYIEETNHTLWQTFEITGSEKTPIPILQNSTSHTSHYTDEEKAESLAVNFEKIHNSAQNTTSLTKHDMERLATLPPWTIADKQIKHIIKKLPFHKTPNRDKITTTVLKKLPIKSMYKYITSSKPDLNFLIFLATASYETLEINKDRVTQLILLDLEKVFDSVWHGALLVKLQRINTPSPLFILITSFL